MSTFITRLQTRIRRFRLDRQNRQQIVRINRALVTSARLGQQPLVAFFNATTRLAGISQNAAFSWLAANALQFAGTPVVHFACKAGLSHCVLATASNFEQGRPCDPPPCKSCVAQSRLLFSNAPTIPFTFRRDAALEAALQPLDIAQLDAFEVPLPGSTLVLPLGALVLPSLRWSLRRHCLQDDETTRYLLREYVLSAYHLAREFSAFLDRVAPQAVVVFNGVMYPEGVARWLARQRGLRVISHEVGHAPFSAFFTDGDATAYSVEIPADFDLTPEQNARLDAYLEQRFQGKFSMAGIRFWPEIAGLSEAFLQRAAQFRQIVPVFTNVIFDTSQIHANVLFTDMFTWLDGVKDLAACHPDTLFVIRAHPDEMRPGKSSRENVQGWVQSSCITELPNVIFVPSGEYLSSYELIQRSKFIMVYNSTIGLEAALMGAAVLCAGKSRYTQIPTVFLPASAEEYARQADEFLAAEKITIPDEFCRNARRYLYYSQYVAALPLGEFMRPHQKAGFVALEPLAWGRLDPARSPVLRALVDGILHGKPFVMPQ